MPQRILALELGDNGARAALGERAWSSFTLLGAYQEQRAENEPDVVPAIRRLLDQTGPPDIVISALPGELVAKRVLSLPFHDHRRLEQAVPFALEEHLPFGVEDGVVAFAPLIREGGNSQVLAALVRNDDMHAHLDLLAAAGLDPKTVTLSSLALSFLINRSRNGEGPSSHLLLDLDGGRTSVILTDDNGVPRALRTLPVGVDQAADGERGDGGAGVIIAAVRQTMLAQSAESAPADLIISGPGAVSLEVRNRFSRELALPIHGLEDFDYSALFGQPGRNWIGLASCVAMLLGELPSQPVPLINFRSGEFAFHGRTGDLAPLYTSAAFAVALALLGVLHLVFNIAASEHHLSLLNRAVVRAAAPVVTGQPADKIKRAMTSRLATARKRLGLLGGSEGAVSPLDALLSISSSLPDQLAVDVDDLTIDDTGLKLSGKADSYAIIDEVKKSLADKSRLADVQVSDEAPAEGHKVAFHLSATVKDAAAGGE